jgi:glycine/D-amino acid oxidase-like deaminating enzyme
MQAPAIGLLLAQRFVDGGPHIDLSRFSHQRFAAAAPHPELNVI